MNLIVAVDKNWAIGCDNKLLYSVPEDMAFFKQKTLGKVVVMGGKTFQSLPSGALKGRKNIVLSRNIQDGTALVCRTLPELFSELEKYDGKDIFIIGGEMFYRAMLPFCDTAYVTKIEAEAKDKADAFFPDLDLHPGWELVETRPETSVSGYKITCNIYKQKEPCLNRKE